MSELKPCPFCGGEAELSECPNCGELNIMVDHADDCWMQEYEDVYDISSDEKEMYLAAWNTRAVEVVRCRDCESWSGPCCGDHEQGTCSGWSTASGTTLIVTKADDFCSYGARRDEE